MKNLKGWIFVNDRNALRIGMMILLTGIFLFTVGCSSFNDLKSTPQDENITTIKTVLQSLFVGPDQNLTELLESLDNATIIGNDGETSPQETPTDLDLYLEEKYKSHFTKDTYSHFIGAYALTYQAAAYENNYKLNVENIDIKQNETTEDAYDFTVSVICTKEGNEKIVAKVSGKAHIYEEGKIASFKFYDDGGLLEKLKTEN